MTKDFVTLFLVARNRGMSRHLKPTLSLRFSLRILTINLCLVIQNNAFSQENLVLDYVVEELRKNNPELQSYRSQERAETANIGTEVYLPPPTLTFGSMGEQNPFSMKMEESIGITQMIPFPSKAFRKREALKAQAEVARAATSAVARQLLAESKKTFFDYWRFTQTEELLKENLDILQEHVKRIRSAPFRNQLMQAHLLSVQSDEDLAQNELYATEQEIKTIKATLNALMGRDPSLPLARPTYQNLSPLPVAPSKEKIDQLVASHPSARQRFFKQKSMESALSASRSDYLPDLMVGYRYNKRHDNTPNNHELMLGITMPFAFPWQVNARVETARHKAEAARHLNSKEIYDLKLQVLKSFSQLTSFHSQLLQLEKKILPQAQKRQHIAHGIAPTDFESLMEHRDALESYVDLKLKHAELRANYEKALVDYQTLFESEEQ